MQEESNKERCGRKGGHVRQVVVGPLNHREKNEGLAQRSRQ